jgi:hypothetical protein
MQMSNLHAPVQCASATSRLLARRSVHIPAAHAWQACRDVLLEASLCTDGAPTQVVIAKMQQITVKEFLPKLGIRMSTLKMHGRKARLNVPDISLEFAVAAYRFGHDLVPDNIGPFEVREVHDANLACLECLPCMPALHACCIRRPRPRVPGFRSRKSCICCCPSCHMCCPHCHTVH